MDRVGDQQLAGRGALGHPGRDVHVHAQVVAAHAPRAAQVQAGAQPRRVALALQPAHGVEGAQGGLHAVHRIVEHGHQAVAERLDHLAAVVGHRLLGGVVHVAEQLDDRLVAGLQRPGREVDQVGEQDRHVHLAAAPALGLGDRLPHLQRRQAGLAGQRVAVAAAQLVVAGQHLASHGGRLEQPRLAVGRLQPLQGALAALALLPFRHLTRRLRWSSRSKELSSRSWSARITCMTALIRARWVNACGKLPRWRPERGSISSA